MRCEKCNVEVVCKTNVCPLCHSELKVEDFPAAYASQKKRRGRRQIPFSQWYLSIATISVVVVAIVSFALSLRSFWTLLTLGLSLYFYFCIITTVLSYKHLNMKIFGQTAALTVLGILLDNILSVRIYVFEIILPIIFLIAILTVTINIIVNINNARSYLVSFFLIVVLGVVPLVVVIHKGELLWPSLTVASISLAILCILVITARKKIAEELTRIFHR